MNCVESEHDFCAVELGPLLRYVILAHEVDEVTSGHVVHHHVQVARILKCIVKLQRVVEQQFNPRIIRKEPKLFNLIIFRELSIRVDWKAAQSRCP